MLRALTSYFFGGTEDDKPCEEMECETKEVKDWLVVNMPDTRDEDLDFESVDPNEACEDDDVLACLSDLMSPFQGEPDWSSSYDLELMNSAYPCELMDESKQLRLNVNVTLDKSSFLMIDESMAFNKSELDCSRPRLMMSESEVCDMVFKSMAENMAATKMRPVCKRDLMKGVLRESQNARKSSNKKSSIGSSHKAKPAKEDLAVKSKENICHPAFTSEFCNHRPLTFHQKTDVLERIKQLEPEQRAQDQAVKKHLTRGQLNRQNKNYIYEKSSKKNRRSNLQRNHSGANNNRRC